MGEGIRSRTERELRGRCSSEEWLVEVLCVEKQLIVPFPSFIAVITQNLSEPESC